MSKNDIKLKELKSTYTLQSHNNNNNDSER